MYMYIEIHTLMDMPLLGYPLSLHRRNHREFLNCW